jgi:colanic acid biosynthesis glycosyl transferase WcaI
VRLRQPVPRAQLATMLAAADAHLVTLQPDYAKLVYPSKLAGVLAAGRPALFVGPPDGEIARLLRDGACGASFAPGDDAGLVATAREWAADRSLVARLGLAAKQTYRSRFTYAAAIDRWEALLRPLVVPS